MYRTISTLVAATLLAAGAAQAAPVAITERSANATTYSFFVIKTKKLRGTYQQGVQDLVNALAPYGVTPCVVAGDVNASISCGVPGSPYFMQPGTGEYFTYDTAFNFKDLPPINDRKGLNKDSAYNQVYAVNFLSPVGTIPGDTMGRNPVHVRFAAPVTEFSFMADGNNVLNPPVRRIQMSVNGVAVEPVVITTGTPTFVGISDPAGFTEVTIVGLEGDTNAYVADRFSFVPMQ